MRDASRALLRDGFAPRDTLNVWQWNAAHVNFSREPSYETELSGPFDPGYIPIWRAVSEDMSDPETEEVCDLKCSRIGASENVGLSFLEWAINNAPAPALFMSSDQLSAEDFYNERIVKRLRCSDVTVEKLATARITEHKLEIGAFSLRVYWPKAQGVFRQHGYKYIYVEEFSKCVMSDIVPIRKRAANWGISKILWVSSPDPTMRRTSKEDPIFVVWEESDKRYPMMPDPGGGVFRFVFGGTDVPHGLKWPADKCKNDDGSWNMDAVQELAYYVTPSGARIEESDRLGLLAEAKWAPSVPGGRRIHGYHANSFYAPFKTGAFGWIAAEFLRARIGTSTDPKNPVKPLRSFVYEYLAEPWYETREVSEETELGQRQVEYPKHTKPSEQEPMKTLYIAKQKSVIMAVDVQKDVFWWTMREFIDGGDSGLMGWGYAIQTEDLDAVAEQYKAEYMGIDYGFALRQYEVMQFALKSKLGGNQWIIPLKGSDNLKTDVMYSEQDPFIGRSRQGEHSVGTYTWATDLWRTILLQSIRGESRETWMVYNGVEVEYAKQVTSTEKIDGVWVLRRGHSQDHLFDCECEALVLARIVGLFQNRFGDGGAR